MAERFFDEHDLFYTTSDTAVVPDRLHLRHNIIIEQNQRLLDGRTVIDVPSHDGRWSFAALRAGAASVTGVEARQNLVDNANKTFAHYGVPDNQYEFVCGDAFDEADRLVREGATFDVAMILGFLYHTGRQYELIYKMARLGVETMIIDTRVLMNLDARPVIKVFAETTGVEANLHEHGKAIGLGGIPSKAALQVMLEAAGYEMTTIEPEIDVGQKAGMGQYRDGRRLTVVGTRH